MNRSLKILMLVPLFFLGACYYDHEEELYPGTPDCNTETATYSGKVSAIIQQNCLVCHSQAANNGNVTLEGFQRLKTYADNGKLLGVITHSAGFIPMPQNAPKLSDCDIATIQQWVAQGAPNN